MKTIENKSFFTHPYTIRRNVPPNSLSRFKVSLEINSLVHGSCGIAQKLARTILLLGYIAAFSGCSTVDTKIPLGIYHEPSSRKDFIDVRSEQIRVHIEGVDDRDKDGCGLTFNYALWAHGEVILRISRSAELLYGYPALDYSWDGEKLIAKDVKSGLRWEFVK